ncbi:MAG: hypothetical protein HY811_08685 [Planctomycetes bacterium]|nr:hypothetical protein [Planctomycetota bacterium]
MKSFIKYCVVVAVLFLIGIDRIQTVYPEEKKETPKNQNGIKIDEISKLDEEIIKKEREYSALQEEAYKAEMEKLFPKAHELKEKANKLKIEINELKNRLEAVLAHYKKSWSEQSWLKQIGIEVGPLYTIFDNDLNINDAWGTSLRVYWIKRDFRRFHIGSYVYYPMVVGESYPLHQVEASPVIIEYRKTYTKTETDGLKHDVRTDSCRIGFGVLSQTWNNTYIKLNLYGGLERYKGTDPEDIGPTAAYNIGMFQRFSDHFALGFEMAESAVWTSANQGNTNVLFNFSATALLRIAF